MTTWLPIRAIIVSALAVATTVGAYAGGGIDQQQQSTQQPVAAEPAGCGTALMNETDPTVALANTARQNPDVYQRMQQRHLMPSPALMKRSSGGMEWTFNVFNRVTNSYDQVNATSVFEGKFARIWVDNTVTNVTPSIIAQLARALDTATSSTSRNPKQGIIQNDIDVYGPVPVNGTFGDRVTDFLLTDIKDNTVGASVLGFFYRSDLEPGDVASNNMNLLYIDSKEGLQGGINSLLSTVAHEFQHLLHYTRNKYSETMYNEGCSEEASLLNGYMDRGNSQFMSNTNIDLFRWSDGALVTADYERAMTFTHYMAEQFGERFLYELVGEKSSGIGRIDKALAKVGSSSSSAEVLSNFAVANYLRGNDDLRFGYTLPIKSGGIPKSKAYTMPTVPADTTMQIQRYATTYLTFNNSSKLATGMRVNFSSDNACTVMAMCFRNNGVEIRQFAAGQSYVIGDYRPYEKVVLAVVNTSNFAQTVELKATQLTLGVADQGAASAASFALTSAPNPFMGTTTIGFTTPSAGPVSLKIFDARGNEVASLIDGDRYEAGEHQVVFNAEDLPNGYYMARLMQGEQTTSRSLVLLK